MPVELNDIITKRSRTIDCDGLFRFDWNPTRMTPQVYAGLEAWREKTDRNPFDLATVYLMPLMTGWDITVDGKPYPVTAEHITALGIDLVVRIGDLIDEDYKLARDAKKASAAS